MNSYKIELVLLLVVFLAVVAFVLKFIVSDLPEDFLKNVQRSRARTKEGEDGRLRDHG